MSNVTGVVSSSQAALGRYLGLVSVLPSMLLVTYVQVLVNAGGWAGTPNWSRAFAELASASIGDLAQLALLGISLGVVLHPLQFAIVQTLEGYWGAGPLGRSLRSFMVGAHRRRAHALASGAQRAANQIPHPNRRSTATATSVQQLITIRDEFDRISQLYPTDPDRILPTRLGNVLRRWEDQAGAAYGLEAVHVVPYLAMVAPSDQVAYLNDQRSALDLAARTSLTAALAFVATLLFLWNDGLWLLVALIPYVAAYVSYRGSVVAAGHYGNALTTIIALNRFALYDRLRLRRIPDMDRERDQNASLDPLLGGLPEGKRANLEFDHPPSDGLQAGPAPPSSTPPTPQGAVD